VRRTIALLSLAVTSMVAIAFLIPLAIIVRDVARDRALTAAELAGASVEPVLAVTTDRATLQRAVASTRAGAAGQLAIYLTGAGSGQALSGGTLIGGPPHASRADLLRTVAAARSSTVPGPGGSVVLQPVALGAGTVEDRAAPCQPR
jgi:hypothetical protein